MRDGRGHDLLRSGRTGVSNCRAPSVDLSVARAHRDVRLGPGRSAAPDDDRLVLLPSGPDTVRGSPLRGTRSSTSRRPAAYENGDLEREFSPAGADCRYRAPLVPRLARPEKDTADRGRTAAFETVGVGPASCRAGLRGARLSPARPLPRGLGGQRGERCGGEGGIRTRDGLPQTAFPVRRHSPLGDLSRRRRNRPVRTRPVSGDAILAERVGFEPTLLSQTAFRERHHQPLGHLSAGEDTKHASHSRSGGRARIRARGCPARSRRAPRPRRGGCRSRP